MQINQRSHKDQQNHLEKMITILSNIRAQSNGTSLITYYLQGGSSVWLAVDKLNSELSTASNIKSKIVRKDVEHAIRCALYQLKNYKASSVPENGLVLCAGNVIENKCCV